MVSIFCSHPSRSDIPGQGEKTFLARENGGKEKNRVMGHRPSLVRTKTFSAHVTPEICHDVRKSGVFTHEKVRPETSHESGRTDESINLICQVSIKR